MRVQWDHPSDAKRLPCPASAAVLAPRAAERALGAASRILDSAARSLGSRRTRPATSRCP